MSYIIKEMSDKVPKAFFRFDILLSTNMTKAAHHRSSAIEAGFFRSFGCVAHNKFLLK